MRFKLLFVSIFSFLFICSNAQIKISALPKYTGSLTNSMYFPLADSGSTNTYKYAANNFLKRTEITDSLNSVFRTSGNTPTTDLTFGTLNYKKIKFVAAGANYGYFDGLNYNVFIGPEAGTGNTGTNNLGLGIYPMNGCSGSNNIALGFSSGYNSGNNTITMGMNAGDYNTKDYVVLLGNGATATTDNQLVFGGSLFNVRMSNIHSHAHRLHYFPDANGTYTLAVKVNGTTFNANDSGLVNLGTINTGLTGSGTTNEIPYFNGTSSLSSLSTVTYPNLTELSYVKGVTSSLQTQLNAKQSTLTNPVTGTGTTNNLLKFTGTSTVGNSNISEASTGTTIGGTATATANGQNVNLVNFNVTLASGGFSSVTGSYTFNNRILLNSYLEQNSSSSPNYFQGYNLLTTSTGTAHGTIVLGNNGANQQNGLTATFGGGSKLTAFVQYNGGTSSAFAVNIGGTDRVTVNGNAELLVNTTTSTGDKANINGAVRATQFKLAALNTAPANSSDTGTTGEIRIVNGFIYVCVATNTWQRATLSTF